MSKPFSYDEKIRARLSRLEEFVGMELKICGCCAGTGAVTRVVPLFHRVLCRPCGGLGTAVTNPKFHKETP